MSKKKKDKGQSRNQRTNLPKAEKWKKRRTMKKQTLWTLAACRTGILKKNLGCG